jgi:secreted trypsin-like serine protease
MRHTLGPGTDAHEGAARTGPGGPIFYGGYESNTVVAVTSFGLNSYCRGTDFSYRVDTQAGQDWIRSVIGDAEFAQVDIVTL